MEKHHNIKESKTHGGPEGMPIKVIGEVVEKGSDFVLDSVLNFVEGPKKALEDIIIPGKSSGGGGDHGHGH